MGNGDVDMNKQTNMNAMTRSGGIYHRQGLDLHNEVWNSISTKHDTPTERVGEAWNNHARRSTNLVFK